MDREALPWQADWYRSKVQEHLGDQLDNFRLWLTDNALHGDDETQESPTHTISYLGVLHQALRDLSRWVEEGVAPPPSTHYEVVDGQVIVPADTSRRRGIKPVVSVAVGGHARTDVAVGDVVTFRASAQVPEAAGLIVTMEWDFDGAGSFPIAESVEAAEKVDLERQYSFDTPGVYFPTVRVAAHRNGDETSPYARVQNLARVRVVVKRS